MSFTRRALLGLLATMYRMISDVENVNSVLR